MAENPSSTSSSVRLLEISQILLLVYRRILIRSVANGITLPMEIESKRGVEEDRSSEKIERDVVSSARK